MAIKKQEFYEGAAIHRLACFGGLKSVTFEKPFFLFNNQILVYFKYSTKNRSPWGFTFTPEEQRLLKAKEKDTKIVIGLVCGFDGVAAVGSAEMLKIGVAEDSSIRIACFRKHGEYYKVSGPDGELSKKVAPSDWTRLLGAL